MVNTRAKVLSDLWFRADDFPEIIARDFLLSFAFSVFIALCSQIAFPLPFSPVPITGQTFAVILTGLVLGRNRALAALLMYVFEGALGLPVFAPGGAIGIARLFGPTGGYIIGFIVAAFFLGYMAERGWDRSFFKTMIIILGAFAIIYSLGIFRLSFFLPQNKLLIAGFYPFIPGEIIKTTLVSLALPIAWEMIKD